MRLVATIFFTALYYHLANHSFFVGGGNFSYVDTKRYLAGTKSYTRFEF